jgi:hypothetical protein
MTTITIILKIKGATHGPPNEASCEPCGTTARPPPPPSKETTRTSVLLDKKRPVAAAAERAKDATVPLAFLVGVATPTFYTVLVEVSIEPGVDRTTEPGGVLSKRVPAWNDSWLERYISACILPSLQSNRAKRTLALRLGDSRISRRISGRPPKVHSLPPWMEPSIHSCRLNGIDIENSRGTLESLPPLIFTFFQSMYH